MNAILDLSAFQEQREEPNDSLVSVFDGPVTNTTRQRLYSAEELYDILTGPPMVLPDNTSESKSRGPYLVRGAIEGSRKDENLKTCCTLPIDIDKPDGKRRLPTPEQIHRELRGIFHVVHPTASPGRSRVIFFVDPYHQGDAARLTWAVYHFMRQRGLYFAWAGESKTLSQPWYLPQTTDPEKYQSFGCKGTKFQVDFAGNIPPYREKEECSEKPDQNGEPHNHLEEFIAELQSGTIHEAAKKYAGWKHRTTNLTNRQIFDELTTLIRHHCSDRGKAQRWFAGERESFERWFNGHVGERGRHNAFDGYAEEAQEKPFSFVHGFELVRNLKTPDWHVDERIENDTVGAWYGESECFKSFLAIASLLCTATGTEFYGLPVRQVPSFYICGEGKSAVGRRVRAWEIFNGRQLTKDDPFFCIDRFNMLSGEPKTRNQLIAEIHEILRYFKLEGPLYIVYDTLSSLFSIEESSNSEMAAALRTVNHIRRETGGGTSHVIHHTGHGNKDRHRGAYSLKANVDAYHHIYREEKPSMMTCWKGGGKMKDAEPLKDMWFKAHVVEIGLEYKGRQVTSLALDHVPDYDPALVADQTTSKEQTKLFNLLLDCQEGTKGIHLDKLAELAVKAGVYTRKSTATRGIMRLVGKDVFVYANDRICTK